MKKIYIHTDLEGISGIDKGEMVKGGEKANSDYVIERLMADVNASVDGAFLGGASHVTVLDSHGGGGNFNLDLLDSRAEFDEKPNKKWWGILDASYFGSFFIGAHPMAGTLRGFLDHTQSSESIYNYYVNGRKMGELGQWAMVCGHYGVPLVMMSGDLAAANEAAQFFPGIETAVVKTAISRRRAKLEPVAEAVEAIRRAAKTAAEKEEGGPKPFLPLLPIEIKIEYLRSDYCDHVDSNPAVERLDARSARMVAQSYQDFWF
ncbi:MAG: M55 family metallopeptidase [Oscillospiraceae bacterium]|nr:M55 family metallopeptidase [Oscillospiraceae bacterium]